jgi:hypothetical protein
MADLFPITAAALARLRNNIRTLIAMKLERAAYALYRFSVHRVRPPHKEVVWMGKMTCSNRSIKLENV